MIRFDIVADSGEPLTIQFEPAANELVLEPGDKITIEWPDWDGRTEGAFYYRAGKVVILEPSAKRGEWPRVWNSQGEEITY
ncbi:hypothetical protein ABH920_005498 [Catenulispora sp. EB89]|uniref:hypothetical protein n=1 Tax=Catenulispora sp. EB89 TaxID=3156257 RepID=UPI0035178830